MQNLCYFVGDPKTKEIAIIDPGWEPMTIQNIITKEKLKPKAIILTHGHFDHAGEASLLQNQYQIPVYISDQEDTNGIHSGLSVLIEQDHFTKVPDNFECQIGEVHFQFLQTPGHTPGGQCILVENEYLFTGDTLFLDGCGRWDLPLASKTQILNSIKTKIAVLPDNVKIYPGHNYHKDKYDTLKNQKKINPVFK